MKRWFVFCSIISLISCTDLHTSEFLNRIKQLEERLTVIHTDLNSIDTSTFVEIENSHREFINLIGSANDTLDLETAVILDEYLRAMGKIDLVTTNIRVLEHNLNSETESLSKLKKDISNAYGNRSKYDYYIREESAKVDSIEQLYEKIIDDVQLVRNEHVSKYQILMDRFNKLTDSVVNE